MENQIDIKMLVEVTNKALERQLEYFEKPGLYDPKVAILATQSVANYVRLTAAMNQRESNLLGIIKGFSDSPEQFRKYVSQALPEHPLVRKLPLPKK